MNKNIKIAYFLDNFYPQVNGVVTSSINTCFEMNKKGHEVMAVVPKPDSFADYPEDYFPFPIVFQNGFPAYFYPDFAFTYPFSSKVFLEIKKFNPDIIHFHAPFTIGYQAIKIARMLKIPVVGTFHTFFAEPEYLNVIGMKESKFLQRFGWFYSNQFFNRCDAVVSPGIATSKHLLKNNLKVPLHVISNGVEVDKYSNFKFTNKFPVEVKDQDEWILYIGRISKEKSIELLIESFSMIIAKRGNARMLIVGDGPQKKELEERVIAMGLQSKIVFTGMIPNKELLESGIFKKMKLFATASTSENQPMTILEAIMFGLPVVGVDAKGVPELVEENGFIVKPDDKVLLAEKILQILEDQSLFDKFSKKSLELRDKYNIRNTSNQMEALYLNLITHGDKN